ncbi:8715_t:CDS:2, partial [Scutellospora calospora]
IVERGEVFTEGLDGEHFNENGIVYWRRRFEKSRVYQEREEKRIMCLNNVSIRIFYEKNYIFGKCDNNQNLGCGCSYDEIKKKFDELILIRPAISKERRYHCCECHNIFKFYKLDKDYKCKECYRIFCENLDEDDIRKIEYIQSNEYQKNLVNCVVCDKEHKRGNYIEWIGDFCDNHHQIAYKVWDDIQNPNKEIWTRIDHWTESTKSGMSYYPINKSAVHRTILILQGKSKLTYEEALEEQYGDKWNDRERIEIDKDERIRELERQIDEKTKEINVIKLELDRYKKLFMLIGNFVNLVRNFFNLFNSTDVILL